MQKTVGRKEREKLCYYILNKNIEYGTSFKLIDFVSLYQSHSFFSDRIFASSIYKIIYSTCMVQYTHVQVNTHIYVYIYIYMQYNKNLNINFKK